MQQTSTTDNGAGKALQIAVSHMAAGGYAHGPCIATKRRFGDSWEVELAWSGHEGRSATTDPESILLYVDVASSTVRGEEDEWLYRRENPFPTT
jgi:hypothetical protein